MKLFQNSVLLLFILTLGIFKANDGNAFSSSSSVFSENAFSTEQEISPPPPPPDDGTDDGGGVVGTGDPVPIDMFVFVLFGIALFFILIIKKLFPKIEL